MMKGILIDLDGVLNQYYGNYNANYIPPPAVGVEKFLKKLHENYKITIFTTRDIKLTAEWLKTYLLDKYVYDITNEKRPCYIFVDDRAICHNGDFNSTLKMINDFNVHWENSVR